MPSSPLTGEGEFVSPCGFVNLKRRIAQAKADVNRLHQEVRFFKPGFYRLTSLQSWRWCNGPACWFALVLLSDAQPLCYAQRSRKAIAGIAGGQPATIPIERGETAVGPGQSWPGPASLFVQKTTGFGLRGLGRGVWLWISRDWDKTNSRTAGAPGLAEPGRYPSSASSHSPPAADPVRCAAAPTRWTA